MNFKHTDIYRSDAEERPESFVVFQEYDKGGCNTMIFDNKNEAEKAKAELVKDSVPQEKYNIRSMTDAVNFLYKEE